MERFGALLSELAAEHRRVLRECEQLRADAEAWRLQKGAQERLADALGDEDVDEYPLSVSSAHSDNGGTAVVPAQEEADLAERAHEVTRVECVGQKAATADGASRPCSRSTTIWHASERQRSKGSPPIESCKSKARSGATGQWDSRGSFSLMLPSRTRSEVAVLTLLPRWVVDRSLDENSDMVDGIAASAAYAVVKARANSMSFKSEQIWVVPVPVILPSSKVCLVWGMVSLAALSYDVMIIPMAAFTKDEVSITDGGHQQILQSATTVFWTCDIILSFLTGFYTGAVVETQPATIAKRYIKGWFAFDVLIVSLDWVVTVSHNAAIQESIGVGRLAKALRILRIVRLFRLLRMLNLPNWAQTIGHRVHWDGFVTVIGVVRSLLIIAIANHFIACAWYWVGGHGGSFTWVRVLDDEERDVTYRYATSLHWSVTQFTPASMEVVPRNAAERVFAIVVILMGMVAFSCFVSSITQAMGSLRRARAERDAQQSSMRRYLAENSISLELGHRITAFVRTHSFMRCRRVHMLDVEIFQLLPPSLREALHCEVYMPVLCQHPLLQRTLGLDDTLVQEVCRAAMREISLGRCEELYHPGQDASFAYFMQSGSWEYRLRRPPSSSLKKYTLSRHCGSAETFSEGRSAVVFEGAKRVCEVALWLEWKLQGYVSAVTNCEGVSLSAKTFGDIAARKPPMFFAFREYAARYLTQLDQQDESSAIELGLEVDVVNTIVQETLDAVDEMCMSRPVFDEQRPQHHSESPSGSHKFGSMLMGMMGFRSDR